MAGERDDTAAPPPLSESLKQMSTYLAMCVRTALEGTLHGGDLGDFSLTDAQMARLNPIVRDAIATGLHAQEHYLTEQPARSYADFQVRLVPSYWEAPALLPDYEELWETMPNSADDLGPLCRRCGGRIVDIARSSERPRWTHVAADGGLNVGCRAASFVPGQGWNDDLPCEWNAAPPRE